jgi:hypothetical protein
MADKSVQQLFVAIVVVLLRGQLATEVAKTSG